MFEILKKYISNLKYPAYIIIFILMLIRINGIYKKVGIGTIKVTATDEEENTVRVKIGFIPKEGRDIFYHTYFSNHFMGKNTKLYLCDITGNNLSKAPLAEEFRLCDLVFCDIAHGGWQASCKIVDWIARGELDGGIITGESFIVAVNEGIPIVAVSILGCYTDNNPGYGLLLRKGVIINSPEDFKNKKLCVIKDYPRENILLREFLENIGIDESNVKMIELPSYSLTPLEQNTIDGGIVPICFMDAINECNLGYVYRKLDWLSPEMLNSVLVFRKDFIAEHPELVQDIVNAYVEKLDKYMKIYKSYEFQYAFPLVDRVDLLSQMQDLLLKYGYIKKNNDLKNYVNNTFVERACSINNAN